MTNLMKESTMNKGQKRLKITKEGKIVKKGWKIKHSKMTIVRNVLK